MMVLNEDLADLWVLLNIEIRLISQVGNQFSAKCISVERMPFSLEDQVELEKSRSSIYFGLSFAVFREIFNEFLSLFLTQMSLSCRCC